ncbi:predicted protein [Pyrenophora tritici-repentis Pt-1C-BFP]|uniref:Uncharacterized protein n=1 Tax=Pyrenophora tritici-repentis (strain Pt-1C-BFP) TaxID=426418 RepID=B2W8V5_PYRTR|nr:uncharacterized protein PTRG_06413 [Pyrenophora tritici-repentis Pt-1C-BFP]EDU49333.1 predicted protein [Pyrenophora tritici-repentis Pt-1C-BFP]
MTGLAIIHEDYEDPTPTPNTPARGWVVCRRDSPAAHTLEAPPNPMFVVTPSILVNRNCSAECEDERMRFLGFKVAFYVDGPVHMLES